MADTKKTTTKSVKNQAPKTTDTENENLKQQIAEMQAQMELMAKMLSNSQVAPEKENVKKERQIPFINMTCGTLVLKGNNFYAIEGQFQEKKFLEREARLIVNNMHNAIAEGYVYIADAEFVKDCELDYLYATLLSDEQLKTLLENNADYVVEVYKSASEGQKELIIQMIENKRLAGEYVDANVLVELGKIANRDLMNIEPEED